MTLKCKSLLGLLFIFTLHFLLPTPPAAADTVYTVNNNGSVSLIETSNDTFTGTIPLPFSAKPTAICLNTVSPHAYTLNSGDNTVSVIDTKNKSVVSTVNDTRFTGLTTIACDPTGTRILIGNNDASGTSSNILYLNTATLALDSRETAVGKNPGSIVFNKNGSKAYVLSQGVPSISVLDTTTLQVTGSPLVLSESEYPFSLAIHTNDIYLYVINLFGTVTFINPATMEVFPSPRTVENPYSIYVSNKTNTLYVSDIMSNVSLVNPVTQSITSSFTSESPIALVERNDGQRIYVASESDNIIRSYDTSSLTTPPITIPLPINSSPQTLATLLGTRHILDLTITGSGKGDIHWPFNAAYPQSTSGEVRVPEGVGVSVNASADACSTVVWNGCDSTSGGGTGSALCLVEPSIVDKSVGAEFTKKIEHTITTSVSGGGGSINCPTQVCEGANVICSITPALGYEFSSLKDNGSDILGSVTGGDTFQIQNILGAHAIVAGFTLRTFTITASSDINGAIAPSPQTVSYGNTASFTLTPNSGFSPIAVSGCAGTVSGNIYTTGPITGDCTVSAAFTPGSFTVTTQAPVGGGSISCLPSTVLSGGSSNCTITPNVGFHLENLNDSGTDKTLSVIGASYHITNITLPHDVVALFINSPPVANGQSVTTLENQSRSITLGGSDVDGSTLLYNVTTSPSHGLLSGIAPNATYTPTEGYVGTDSFTFNISDGINTSVAATVNITVTQVTRTVSFAAGANGTVTGASPQTINWNGTAAQITANPDSGYHFVNWTDAGSVVVSTANPLILTNVKSDMTITANFSLDPINGACGTDEGKTLAALMPTNLCSTGSPTTVTGSGHPWSWSCAGQYGGTTPPSCSATIKSYNVSFATPANGSVNIITTQQIDYGASTLAVTATADIGYHFVNWTGTGGFTSTSINPLTVNNVTADMSITANFSTTPVNGVCGADNEQAVAALFPTNLCSAGTPSAIAGNGKPWSWICEGQYGGTTPTACTATIKQYIASFTLPVVNGSISDSTAQTLDYGTTTAPVNANPNSGYHFVNWTGTNGFVTTTSNPLTVANVTTNMTITANFANSPPTANGQSVATPENQARAITLTGNDPELGSLTYTVVASPAHGILTGTAPNSTYSPTEGYVGTDNFTFNVSDGINTSVEATVTITVTQVTRTVSFVAGNNGTVTGNSPQTINWNSGTSTVTANANTGYHFVNWTGTNGFATNTANPLTVTNVTADMNITANFSLAPINGSCGTDSGNTLASLIPSNLCSSGRATTIIGNGHPWSWSCEGQYGGTTPPSCFAAIKTYNVSFATPANGSVDSVSAQQTDYGASTLAVTATADIGYHFVNWTGTGGFASTNNNPLTVNNVTADIAITANFSATSVNGVCGADSGQILATVAPTNLCSSGTASAITGNGHPWSWSCDGQYGGTQSPPCSATIQQYDISVTPPLNGSVSGGTSQTLDYGKSSSAVTATAGSGYHFVNWTGTNGFVTTTSNPLTVTDVMTNMSITANFNSSKYSTTTSVPGGNGSVYCTPASADFGTSVSCSITSNEGYQLASLVDNGAALLTSPDATLHTINSINSNHSLAATFTLKSYVVTINTGANGSSTPSAAHTVLRGNVLSILLIPEAGYFVSTPLSSSCGGTLSGTTYTTAAITANCTISVAFEPNQYTLSATATSGGSITPATAPALHGSTTIFSVAPNTGYYTGSVYGCGGKLSGTIYTTEIITGDCSISATFIARPVVTASAFSSNGEISCTKPAIVGDTVTCLTTPDKGYHLATLTDNEASVLSSVTNKNNYILNNISSSHNIAATFTPYTLDNALQALRYAVKIAAPKPDEYLWLDVAPIEADKPKGNGVIDIMDALVLLKHSIGSYTAW